MSGELTKRSRVFCVMSCWSIRELLGADWEEIGSVSSRKGFVDFGRSGRPPEVVELEGDRVRVRKGLLEPRFTGNCWREGEGEARRQTK
ncbi:hypothetical protein BDW66DRAFT_32253 [Aspergillus desertorum]